jgi:hypothetical protein
MGWTEDERELVKGRRLIFPVSRSQAPARQLDVGWIWIELIPLQASHDFRRLGPSVDHFPPRLEGVIRRLLPRIGRVEGCAAEFSCMGYNVQVAVDVRHKLIVQQQVTNQFLDMGLLTQTAAPREGDPGRAPDRRRCGSRLLQDRGYLGLREGRHRALSAATPTRPLGQDGPVPQG